MAGAKLLRGAEAILKDAGVARVHYETQDHVRLGKRRGTLGDLLRLLGYKRTGEVFIKVL